MKVPKHYSPVMPYYVVSDADGFINFIRQVFDAKELLKVPGENGSLMHAEYSINGGTIMFGEGGGDWKAFPSAAYVVTDQVDEIYRRGLGNGATGNQEPTDRGYGRAAGFIDQWGNQWWLNNPE